MKYVKETIITGLSVLLALFAIYSSILHNRLVETRYELDTVKQRATISTELGSQFRERAERAEEQLSEIGRSIQYSIDTTGELSEQINEIKLYIEYLEEDNNNLRNINNNLISAMESK